MEEIPGKKSLFKIKKDFRAYHPLGFEEKAIRKNYLKSLFGVLKISKTYSNKGLEYFCALLFVNGERKEIEELKNELDSNSKMIKEMPDLNKIFDFTDEDKCEKDLDTIADKASFTKDSYQNTFLALDGWNNKAFFTKISDKNQMDRLFILDAMLLLWLNQGSLSSNNRVLFVSHLNEKLYNNKCSDVLDIENLTEAIMTKNIEVLKDYQEKTNSSEEDEYIKISSLAYLEDFFGLGELDFDA